MVLSNTHLVDRLFHAWRKSWVHRFEMLHQSRRRFIMRFPCAFREWTYAGFRVSLEIIVTTTVQGDFEEYSAYSTVLPGKMPTTSDVSFRGAHAYPLG